MRELEAISSQLRKKLITRRKFIERSLALGVGLTFANGMADRLAHAAGPKKGGLARLGLSTGSTSDSADPGLWPASFPQNVYSGSMSNRLTYIRPNGSIEGDLAETFEPGDKGKTWTFHLRKGLTFHNGKSVTSDDVVASVLYHSDENSKSAYKSSLGEIESVSADGPEKIIFKLKSGNADFPYVLADYHMVILPMTEGGKLQFGVGTGPFILEDFRPGESAKMKRNPNYHKPGLPYFDEVEYLNIADGTARINALLAGSIDYMANVPYATIDLISKSADVEILSTPSSAHVSFDMKTAVKPFDDVNVRLALKHAMNRDEIVSTIFMNQATPGNDNPVASSVKYYIDPQPKHTYDPEKVKFYLKKAGMSGLTVDLSVSDTVFTGCNDAGVLYKEQAAKAGIDINVIREPNDGYYSNVWNVKPFSACEWYGRPTADGVLSLAFESTSGWNDTDWKRPEFDKILHEARGELDESKRATMYAELQQMLHDEGGQAILAFRNYVTANSKRLAHGEVSGVLPDDNLGIAERWWFAS